LSPSVGGPLFDSFAHQLTQFEVGLNVNGLNSWIQ